MKGYFKPRNPTKYKGDRNNIIYRSSWELRAMIYFDTHPDIVQWSSEEIAIPYVSPIDGSFHRYYPDFCIKKRNIDGSVETVIIEIKPKKQTQPPKVQTKKTKTYINEVKTWGINSAKWEAAKRVCTHKNWKFTILTEDNLGVK